MRVQKIYDQWIENQGEHLYKMLKNCSLIYFGETLDEL